MVFQWTMETKAFKGRTTEAWELAILWRVNCEDIDDLSREEKEEERRWVIMTGPSWKSVHKTR